MRVQKPIIHAINLHALGVDGGRVQFLDVLDRAEVGQPAEAGDERGGAEREKARSPIAMRAPN